MRVKVEKRICKRSEKEILGVLARAELLEDWRKWEPAKFEEIAGDRKGVLVLGIEAEIKRRGNGLAYDLYDGYTVFLRVRLGMDIERWEVAKEVTQRIVEFVENGEGIIQLNNDKEVGRNE